MALTRIHRTAEPRHFLVYDMEWIPGTLHVRTIGVFDGRRFRRYSTVDDFIRAELTSHNRGKWFYAHAGGTADLQFVLQAIHRHHPDIAATGSFSGSSVVICHVKRGHNVWHFLDSFFLLRASLAKIGESIGMAKGGPDKSNEDARAWFATVPDDELFAYNEQDCRILWHAINQFEDLILSLGGSLQMTLASTAMTLFRRVYLQKDIVTCEPINNIAREAYIASRVEVLERECDNAYYYDVNSSFPYAMTHALPGQFRNYYTRLTDRMLRDDTPCLVRATIRVPETHLPPLPYRSRDRLYFPTGRWRQWFTNIDIALLLEAGGTLEHVDEILEFSPFYDMREYVEKLYGLRKNARTTFEKDSFKLLLNTLYGKTAEMSEKVRLLINPSPEALARLRAPDPHCPECRGQGKTASHARCLCIERNYRGPGLWAESFTVAIPHVHVPIAAQVTAIGRRTLYRHLVLASIAYYCDTDGFAASDTYAESVELGGLKLEKLVDEGTLYLAPKVYKLNARIRDGDTWTRKLILKAKGFSLGKNEKVALQRFTDLASGLEVQVERMSRIRENLRRGILDPKESIVTKALHTVSPDSRQNNTIIYDYLTNADPTRTKRHFFPDGTSRPWSIDEIRE